MGIVIIKYNAGNVQSVQYALKRLGTEAQVTDDEQLIRAADKVIFPGVGHAAAAMESLKEKKLDLVIKSLQQPVLGIWLTGNRKGKSRYNSSIPAHPPPLPWPVFFHCKFVWYIHPY